MFPLLTDINKIKDAIEGIDEFSIRECPEYDYGTVDYHVVFQSTFPPIENEQDALLRECRGLTFKLSTGEILSRKYHKFFNIGEREESLPENIDFSKPHLIMEKLDGSLITPLIVDDKLRFCTKNGLTDISKPVDEFATGNALLHEFCMAMIGLKMTPLFEWCSPAQQIVIDHKVSRLVLTGIRNNLTGRYTPYDELALYKTRFDLDLVKVHGRVENITDFIASTRKLVNAEGYVIWFDDGLRVKVKGDWYTTVHKTIDDIAQEKNIIKLIIDGHIDDVIGIMPQHLKGPLQKFTDDVNHNINYIAKMFIKLATDNRNITKQEFAKIVMATHKSRSRIAFAAWDNDDVVNVMHNQILRYVGSGTRLDMIRHLFGDVKWSDYLSKPHWLT